MLKTFRTLTCLISILYLSNIYAQDILPIGKCEKISFDELKSYSEKELKNLRLSNADVLKSAKTYGNIDAEAAQKIRALGIYESSDLRNVDAKVKKYDQIASDCEIEIKRVDRLLVQKRDSKKN